jgi:hypothetical protein
MSRSGQGAGRPPLAIAAGSRRSAAQPGDSGFDGQMALRLGVVGHVLRSRGFYEKVAVAAIVLGALRGIGQDNQARTMARLQAWDKRQIQRMERRAQRQGRAVTGSARMARSGPPKAWPRQVPRTDDHGLGCGPAIKARCPTSRPDHRQAWTPGSAPVVPLTRTQ